MRNKKLDQDVEFFSIGIKRMQFAGLTFLQIGIKNLIEFIMNFDVHHKQNT